MDMYNAIVNSPITQLSVAVSDTSTTIQVLDASLLPDAPNLATIGKGENAETILYTGKSGNELTGVTRGFEGVAQAWDINTQIARFYTAYDHNTFKTGIENNEANLSAHLAQKATETELGHITLQQLGMRNLLINPNFDIWQRGILITGTNVYSADRWRHINNGTSERSTDVPNDNSKYSIKFTSGDSLDFRGIAQRIEAINAKKYAGKQSVLSFWIKPDTNCINNKPYVSIQHANLENDFSNLTTISNITLSLTADTWQKITIVRNLPTDAKNGLNIAIHVNGSSSSSVGSANIAQVQIETGDIATPFEQRPIGLELGLCQRYFERIVGNQQRYICNGYAKSSTNFRGVLTFSRKRVNPTLLPVGTFEIDTVTATGGYTLAFGNSSIVNGYLLIDNATNIITGDGGTIRGGTGDCYIDIDAEL